MFTWHNKTIVQKCQHLANLGYLFTASKKLYNRCINSSCEGTVMVDDLYYSSTKEVRPSSYVVHKECVDEVLKPYRQTTKVLTELTVPVRDAIFIEDLIEDAEEELKYSDESWEAIVEDTNKTAYTIHQAAELLGVATRTIYNYVKKGRIERVGNDFLIADDDPLVLAAEKKVKQESTQPKVTTVPPRKMVIQTENPVDVKTNWMTAKFMTAKFMGTDERLVYLEGKVDALNHTIETLYKLILEGRN